MDFPSARELDDHDLALVELATRTIEAATDADPTCGDGIHTVGAAVMAGDHSTRDRQVLADYHPRCRVIVPTPDGLRSVTVDDLLPGAFRGPEARDEP